MCHFYKGDWRIKIKNKGTNIKLSGKMKLMQFPPGLKGGNKESTFKYAGYLQNAFYIRI
jgi:hypothetical protein